MQFQFMQFQMANAIKNVFASFASNFSYRSSCFLLYMKVIFLHRISIFLLSMNEVNIKY
jgi:hypothetical protein